MQEKINNQELLTKNVSAEDIATINNRIQSTINFKVVDSWFEKSNAFKLQKDLTFRKEMILFLCYLFNEYSFGSLDVQFQQDKKFEAHLFECFTRINPDVCVPEKSFYTGLRIIKKLPVRQREVFFGAIVSEFQNISKSFFPQQEVFYTDNAYVERGGQKNMMKYQRK